MYLSDLLYGNELNMRDLINLIETGYTPPTNLANLKDEVNALGVSLQISERGGYIELSKIVVPAAIRNTGIGTSAMKLITEYADRTNQTITLTPSSDFGGNKSRLVRFYASVGFVNNKGKQKDYQISDTMYRVPKSKTVEENMEIRYLLDRLQLIEYDTGSTDVDKTPDKKEPTKPTQQAVQQPTQRLAPNGKPSNLNAGQYQLVRSPNFKAWFGDWEHDNTSSDIVGANTEPLVCYRGNAADFGDTFAHGVTNLAHKSVKNTFGFFFTSESADTRHYTANNTGNTQAVFLNIRNPIRIREEYLSDITEFKNIMKAASVSLSGDTISSITDYLDGVTSKFNLHATHKYLTGGGSLLRRDLISAGYDGMLFIEDQHDGAIIVAFNANQIKSAIGNTGSFSTKSDKIHEEF
jgi:hypothetical protein